MRFSSRSQRAKAIPIGRLEECVSWLVGVSLAISVVRERILWPAHEKLNKNIQKANPVSLGPIPLPDEVIMLDEDEGLDCTEDALDEGPASTSILIFLSSSTTRFLLLGLPLGDFLG